MKSNHQGVWMRVWRKLPELLIETVSVIFAVLLALMINQWQKNKDNDELLLRSLMGITTELENNLKDMQDNVPKHERVLQQLDEGINALKSKKDGVTVDTSVYYVLFSASAWEAAKLSGAINQMKFEWIDKLSETYRLQALYENLQSQLVLQMSSSHGDTGDDDDRQALRIMNQSKYQVSVLLSVNQALITFYQKSLAMLETIIRTRQE